MSPSKRRDADRLATSLEARLGDKYDGLFQAGRRDPLRLTKQEVDAEHRSL